MNTELIFHDAPEGYVDVPNVPYFAVSKEGKVWNKRSNIQSTISIQKSGYRTVAIGIDKKTKTHYVHRMVAETFIEIPEYLKGIPNLEVNHKFADKSKNGKDDLEWMTPKQNISHALSIGQFKNKKLSYEVKNSCFLPTEVEVKNTKTGGVIVFPNVESCASVYGINRKRLARHLESDKAGRLTKNWCVFRKVSKEPWPHIPEDRLMENRWDKPNGMWFVRHIESGIAGHSETMQMVADKTLTPYNVLQYAARADGKEYVVNGHVFWYDDYPHPSLLNGSDYKREHKFNKVRRLKVTNMETSEESVFPSIRNFAKSIDVHPRTIEYCIKEKGFYKHYALCLEN